ncbi:hypothetical protein GCM10027034_18180 [Ramlibacter solisilvae]
MLVAQRVTQFDASPGDVLGRAAKQRIEPDDHDVLQIDSHDSRSSRSIIPRQYITVPKMHITFEGDCQVQTPFRRMPESGFLGLPLVEVQHIDMSRVEPVLPRWLRSVS